MAQTFTLAGSGPLRNHTRGVAKVARVYAPIPLLKIISREKSRNGQNHDTATDRLQPILNFGDIPGIPIYRIKMQQ